ncbi:DUF2510 domain-containing protein [Mycobacterium intracellulare]|uniref:DUF2510 domain-containing protein n=1 Tax=Mycobacterium intracellulare TaxID=1767 RepID=UPI0033649832
MREGTYRLGGHSGGTWCNYDVVGEKSYGATIHTLLPSDWDGRGIELRRDFELIPEPANTYDPWAIAVRADDRTVGYLAREDAQNWAGTVRRVLASGYTPIVPGRVYAFSTTDWDSWDGSGEPPQDLAAKVQLKLDEASAQLPINDPPAAPYTLLPSSSLVQVTKEDQFADAVLKFVPPSGYGPVIATLHELDVSRGNVERTVVEVRIDDRCVGQLTPQMSQRYLPLVRHLQSRGLITACWGDITGSAVAAEVRIAGIKANEASAAVLDGEPVTVPCLVPAQRDPLAYQLPAALSAGAEQQEARYRPRGWTSTYSPPAVQAPPLPPAGWYLDPQHPHSLRYWDGSSWTRHTAPIRTR